MPWRNPYYDPSLAHHRVDGFVNPEPEVPVGGDFWRWRRERRAQGLPQAPAAGYAAFAREWSMAPDFAQAGERIWWLGHSTLLLQIDGLRVLTDPVLSERASPLSFVGPARKLPCVTSVAALPDIDLVLISHSHYDHLDRISVQQLARRSRAQAQPIHFIVPLGLGDKLRSFGADNVHELDWWQAFDFRGLRVRATPAQHWSARTPWDRNRTLWCGFTVHGSQRGFYFAGDTGYWHGVPEIVERCGRIDLAALPIGAYAPRWFMKGQHIDPAQAVQMHLELAAQHSIAIHWGTFELADDALDEPPQKLAIALADNGLGADDFWLLKHGESRSLAMRTLAESRVHFGT